MKRIAAACLALATLAGCGVTRDQLKQATYDCRDRNYDAPEAITACDRLLSSTRRRNSVRSISPRLGPPTAASIGRRRR